jgi:hypothetical protein
MGDDNKRSASQSVEDPESPVPEVLYKYLPPERIDILESMELRFSSPSQFNDTFDSHYLVPKSQGMAGKTVRIRLRNRLGIFCLTEKPDNHLMWVHYARNHTGFVLGFNARASFFQENNRVLRKVRYRRGPKVLSEADINACFYKSNQWTYEQEWRCARSFEVKESRVVGIEPNLITHIIFGSRMETWQIARIVLYATALEMMTHTQFLVSSPSRTSWSIENHPKKITLCMNCEGNGYLMKD